MKHILHPKNIPTLIVLLGIFISLNSCEKKIFEEPFQNLEPDAAFSSPERIEKTAIGMYDALQNREFLGGRVFIYADIRGNDVNVPNAFTGIPFFNVTSSDFNTEYCWKDAYRSIYESNYFLKKFQPNSSKVSVEKGKQYTAEAKFIRSLCNFYLVNLFAQPYNYTVNATHLGIPIVTKAVEGAEVFDASNKIPRNTVAEVYAAIEADLLECENNLPANHNEVDLSDVARATKYAAQALLMRLYVYKGANAKAVEYANKLINAGKYKLNASPEIAFRTYAGGDNKESIFSITHSTGDNPSTNHALSQSYSPTAKSEISISINYFNLPGFSASDKRKTLLTKTTTTGSTTLYWSSKYISPADWVPIIRYAEVLLTKAEALAKINTATPDAEALDLLNQIRTRAGATPYLITDILSAADLLDKILLERKIELAFEGQGSFDFLRNGKGIPAHGSVLEQPYGSNYVVLPIPKKETEANPNLIQNPGY